VATKANKGKKLLIMQQQLHADKVIPSIPENKFGKYRSQPGKRVSHNAANCVKTMQSGYADFKVPTGYERSLLIIKINSCFPNTFHMPSQFQCHRTTSLASQAVKYICKIIIHCSKRLSVSHVTYSFTHSPAIRLPSTVRPVVYTRFGLDRQILIRGERL